MSSKRVDKKTEMPKGKRGKLSKKAKIAIIIPALIIVAVLAVGITLVIKMKNGLKNVTGNNLNAQVAQVVSSDANMVMASGVINIGSTEETLDIDNMTSRLVVEEVLFASGDSIREGDAMIRFTEESVQAAEKELTETLREKDLALRAGEIEYNQSLISAKYTYEATVLSGKQADEIYKETVSSLDSSLASAKETYENAVEQLAKYKDAQANDSYYTDYEVGYYKQLYEQNYDAFKKRCEMWGVTEEEASKGATTYGGSFSGSTGGTVDMSGFGDAGSFGDMSGFSGIGGTDESNLPEGGQTPSGGQMPSGMGNNTNNEQQNLRNQYLTVLRAMYSIVQANKKDYENALEQYENAVAELSYNLLSLELSMSSYEESYNNSQKNYEISLLSAEKTRQTAKTNASLAQSEYEATVEKAEADYDSLKSAYEDALSDYETFTTCITDNTYHARHTGTVMRTNVNANGRISAGSRIATYSDLEEITASVSVDQSDIAKLSVGDTVICYSSSSGMLSGTIQSISPITVSESISSVYYSVTVKVDAASQNVSNNTSVTVIFGYDAESASNLEAIINSQSTTGNESGFPGTNGDFDFGNMFGSDGSFNFGNMPDMGNMPNFGGR